LKDKLLPQLVLELTGIQLKNLKNTQMLGYKFEIIQGYHFENRENIFADYVTDFFVFLYII
jgi:hypothetical protein